MALLKVSSCLRKRSLVLCLESTKSHIYQNYRTSLTQWLRPKESNISSKIQWFLAASGVTFTKLVFDCNTAKCQVVHSSKEANVNLQSSISIQNEKDVSFPWMQFFTYLWPHIFALSVAVISAFAVAVLNTKIGISIGSLVNVVSANLPQASNLPSSESFLQQIRKPSLDVLKLYISHAAMTFSYIYSLSIVGKNIIFDSPLTNLFYTRCFILSRREGGCQA